MPPSVEPAAASRLLGAQLRGLRDSRGLSKTDVAGHLAWPPAKLDTIESGAAPIRPLDAEALLTHYDVADGHQAAAIMTLSVASLGADWWIEHRLTAAYRDFIAAEAQADHISVYQALFVPGLLQTEEYGRALTASVLHQDPSHPDVQARLEIRMCRQRALLRRMEAPDPPTLVAYLDEATLRRPVGGPAVMQSQLARLVELAELPYVTLVCIPMGLGAHAGLGGTFELLQFSGTGEPDLLFIESISVDFTVDLPRVTEETRKTARSLHCSGLIGADAVDLIRQIR